MSWSSTGTVAQRAVRQLVTTWRADQVLLDGNSVPRSMTFAGSLLFLADVQSGLVYLNGTVTIAASGSVGTDAAQNTGRTTIMNSTPLPAAFCPDRTVTLPTLKPAASGAGVLLRPDGLLQPFGSFSTSATSYVGDSTFFLLSLSS